MSYTTQEEKLHDVAFAFVKAIENTGGVIDDVYRTPVLGPRWDDLGEAYMAACKVLGRKPMVSKKVGD